MSSTESTANEYEARRAARVERLRARAERKRSEAETTIERAKTMAAVIPFGQPVHVGHYSEGRDRRYRSKIDRTFTRGFEAFAESRELARRAETAESNATISSDDPDAVAKLREKLAEHERQHAALLEANARLRRGASPEDIAPLLDFWPNAASRVRTIMSLGHRTIPLANSSAEARRIRERIAVLERELATSPAAPVTFGAIRVEEGDNRVRIVLPEKPSDASRALLKARGFRWSPTAEAWQRQATDNARRDARQLAQELAAQGEGS